MYGGVYRCIGNTDIWGDVLGAYRCMGDIHGVYKCMEAYRCTGDIQLYGGCTEVWGAYRCVGSTDVGGHAGTPKHTDNQTYPTCMPTSPG